MKFSVIVVTHNSEKTIFKCVHSLCCAINVAEIIIVDSGSNDVSYLRSINDMSSMIQLHLHPNVGFAKANNIGFLLASREFEGIALVNPDVIVDQTFFLEAALTLTRDDVGCVGGRLLRYDFNKGNSTEAIDSFGIRRRWYGCWYDIAQNEKVNQDLLWDGVREVKGICGALMTFRRSTIEEMGGYIFWEKLFMYKEDIEVCWRLRRWHKKKICILGLVGGYHGRGWTSREAIPFFLRKLSSRNDVLLDIRFSSPYIFFSVVKYLIVIAFRH